MFHDGRSEVEHLVLNRHDGSKSRKFQRKPGLLRLPFLAICPMCRVLVPKHFRGLRWPPCFNEAAAFKQRKTDFSAIGKGQWTDLVCGGTGDGANPAANAGDAEVCGAGLTFPEQRNVASQCYHRPRRRKICLYSGSPKSCSSSFFHRTFSRDPAGARPRNVARLANPA